MQRSKTIDILEGRDRYSSVRQKKDERQDDDEDESDPDATPGKAKIRRQTRASKGHQTVKPTRPSDAPGRSSQFLDADEADVKEQIQQQLAAGVMIVSCPENSLVLCKC